MKFELSTTDYVFKEQDGIRLEKMGFEFEVKNSSLYGDIYYIKDVKPVISINTIDELSDFINTNGQVVISNLAKGILRLQIHDGEVE